MTRRTRAQAKAITKPNTASHIKLALLSLILLLAFAAQLFAQENITKSHGYSRFGDLKYPADFKHLEYVNPNAPKGGEISQWAQGTFDSFNPSSRKGVVAALATLPQEPVLTATADDPYGTYCYLCETIEFPESRDWVIFNMRQDVRFSDGTPMTAEDALTR